ncbi:MAG: 3-dehydroquinate synthase [Mariprofundaceae bacterium]|nr:3-dehydroquinate synthase [Mariprofundaceae bacterium]
MQSNHTCCSVELGTRSYNIHIERASLAHIGDAMNTLGIPATRCMVISNATVAPLYLATVCQSLLAAGWQVLDYILPDGEQYKNMPTWSAMMDALMDTQLARNEPIIALGGGVVGDMVGFAAACYRRGVPFIQVPTTLLAQVDSSVGGKTAISHPHGKNMIGAFYQPRLVWIDPDVLATLPTRELRAGLAEVIKYGAIWDASFFDFIDQQAKDLQSLDDVAISKAIADSCRFKADIVMQDETEKGVRALLNLGHTFGHAIESLTHYTSFLHGEAIAIGMCMAARLSVQLGYAPTITAMRMEAGIEALNLPTSPPRWSTATWLIAMGHDKKNIGSHIRYILLHDIGEAFVADDVKDSDVDRLIKSYNSEKSVK